MSNFNEHNYLCHYGIKGMKWGIRRYQNPDGSLTSAGKAKYGTKSNLKKHIKGEISKQKELQEEGMVAQKTYDKARKRLTKAENKYYKKGSEKAATQLRAARNAEKFQKKALDKATSDMKKHYNALVKEFGKESVKDIKYKNGKLNEKTKDFARDIMVIAFGLPANSYYTPQKTGVRAAQNEADVYNDMLKTEKRKLAAKVR